MSDRVVDLFERFLLERDAGEDPDPAVFVAEAGDDGEALSGMIAAYLATHPGQPTADDVVAFAARPELEVPRPWSELLPDLRAREHTTRTSLVERLAAALGVKGAEPQVDGYVHELEAGLRSPLDVRPAVVSALAEILRVPRGLLEASRALAAPSPDPGSPVAFARMAAVPDNAMDMLASEPAHDPRVDDLFTGGRDG
jgi:hypothetical protein